MTNLPIACRLDAATLNTRRDEMVAALVTRASMRQATENGYRIEFSSDDSGVLAAIAHVVEAERQCCRFLRFQITVEPDGGPIAIDLSGPPGTREFLAGLFGA
jgi:hypothetical protein